MKFTAMLRVKNEARWIGVVLRSIKPLCPCIIVMDDHSTDDTKEICQSLGALVLPSPFSDLNEVRDKNWLLALVRQTGPDWIFFPDGDEVLEESGPERIREACEGRTAAYSLRIVYLWDRPNQIRVDGIYGRFQRPSLFRVSGQPDDLRFVSRSACGFHCSNTPENMRGGRGELDVALLHFGYIDREMRLRKYAWYNQADPNNETEDRYRHMVQGDLPEIPADAKLRWAGPLTLQSLGASA